jgi:hypothetical protein
VPEPALTLRVRDGLRMTVRRANGTVRGERRANALRPSSASTPGAA